ncbi:ATP synthase membrane subunit DAPIT, mitochondrial-like [Acyrthosiphon pisum]|uniref:Up-regulated during skeletal muscle growth protein 5 n=1 Tax=Acyrthosiphon pisum TaxID=7029 RepID=A0A8R2JRW6_ACYPI|nr:ATP synthase membrane subunit DAPIT, mitochondrial-like [Acyrthosiphon pisum]|eukprot:XP_016657147.1 PREDICTED: up-regulated during skeletal muscle growth protein 5-like [Acyrthosiphon pisum]
MTSTPELEEKPLTGFSKYFNTTTINGRVNISCATFATLGMFLLYMKFKPKIEKISHTSNEK